VAMKRLTNPIVLLGFIYYVARYFPYRMFILSSILAIKSFIANVTEIEKTRGPSIWFMLIMIPVGVFILHLLIESASNNIYSW
jgi:hypothetical protein